MAEILEFPGTHVSKEGIIENVAELESFVVFGYDKSGDQCFLAHDLLLKDVLWLIEKAKKKLLEYHTED